MRAATLFLVLVLAASGCDANVNTAPISGTQLPAFEVIGSPSPAEPFTSTAAVGTDTGRPVVPLFTVASVPTNLGLSGVVLWGSKDPITGEIGDITEAAVFGLEPPGGEVHAFFNNAQLPVLFRDDASGYAIVVTYMSSTSLSVTLCDPSGNALGQASATVVAGVAQGSAATDGGSCAVSLAGADLSAGNSQTRSRTQTGGGVATNVSDLGRLAPLFASSVYVTGIGSALSAILKFRQHKDNPIQVPIGTPIALIFVAAALLFLPSIISTVGNTLFDSSSDEPLDGVSPIYAAPPAATSG